MFLTEPWRGPPLALNCDTPTPRLGDRGAGKPPELLSSCLGGDRRDGREQSRGCGSEGPVPQGPGGGGGRDPSSAPFIKNRTVPSLHLG